jgi:hypothetical protein
MVELLFRVVESLFSLWLAAFQGHKHNANTSAGAVLPVILFLHTPETVMEVVAALCCTCVVLVDVAAEDASLIACGSAVKKDSVCFVKEKNYHGAASFQVDGCH